MIALVQRVASAHVDVAGAVVGAIGPGLLVLVCAEPGDTPAHARRLVDKLLKLRIFGDDAGKMNRSLQDTQGGLLLVSQFTLAADTRSGNRPSFTGAPRRPWAGRPTTRRCASPASAMRRWPRACSAPICRCTW